MAAYCSRTKRLPKLESLLKERKKLPPQTPEQQIAMARAISAMFSSKKPTKGKAKNG